MSSFVLECWQPTQAEPWDIARVSHLLRRTGFAPSWGAIQQGLRLGVGTAIDRLLQRDPHPTVPAEEQAFEQLATTIGEAAVGADSADRLRAWWVFRMLMTPNPLVERMTLLWHNHFATSNDKVQDVSAMYEQNNLLRKHCLGDFKQLLPAVVKHRALLNWLDASANRKEHPNENLARELMELFTLGEGNYSERDVVEAARCLTGWTIEAGEFRFVPELHDDGEKTVLGQTAHMDGDALLNLLLSRPETARRIAWRLCQMYFGEGVVDDATLEELSSNLRENDLNILAAVEKILRSKLFFSANNLRSRVASPVEWVIGAARSLEMQSNPPSSLLLAAELRKLGQDLFYPPNVFGWGEGREWIQTRSVLARMAFVAALVQGDLHSSARTPLDVRGLPAKYDCHESAERIIQFYSQLITNRTDAAKRFENGFAVRTFDDEQIREMIIRMFSAPESQLV